ncbi:MAG: DAK2 domain-containing protein [Chloroflexota bacterium]|nr:DAK2 domain-containing protein [Chloroflexota bacterium]
MCDGKDLVGMFNAAVVCLERRAAELNSLNVFPVPDGDTGTNMLLTMRSAVSEAARVTNGNASQVARAIAYGALMGARGNSGVILSQILQGLASSLDGKESLEGGELVAGLAEGTRLAYKAVSQPVEGTILTVVKDSWVAAEGASDGNDLRGVLEATVIAAKDSVARTPTLLADLRDAGVVDAGGLGLYVILEGLVLYLRGELDQAQELPAPASVEAVGTGSGGDGSFYGYCTEFMIEGQGLSADEVRARIEAIGESVVVVGDGNVVRVHVHAADPGTAISIGSSMGRLSHVKIDDMDEQHEHFVAFKQRSPVGVAIVAVVSGEGLKDVFESLGATAVVPGGSTMNPSVEELLRAVEAVPSDEAVLLPNDRNVVLGAERVRSLSSKRVEVVPTETIPQGVAALLAFNYELGLDANIEAMEKARQAVKTIEVTRAVRPAKIGDFSMEAGQAIAFLNGDLVAVGDSVPDLVKDMLERMDMEESEIVTIYYGADTGAAEAEGVAEMVRGKYPHLEVEVISGGEPYYHYIVSVE